MCLSNSSTTICQLPIAEFTRSKKEKRRGIPFCVDTKAAILAGLARLGDDDPSALSLLEQPDHEQPNDDVLSRLLRDCNLSHGPAFVHAIYERFAHLIQSMLRLAVRNGLIVDRRWTREVWPWEPYAFTVWLREHCGMKNHWEKRGEGQGPASFSALAPSAPAARHPPQTARLGSDLPAGLARLMEGLNIEDREDREDREDTHAASPTDLILDQILASTGRMQQSHVRAAAPAPLAPPASDSVGDPPAHRSSSHHRQPFATPDTSFVHGLHVDDPAHNPWAEPDTRDDTEQPQRPVRSRQPSDDLVDFGQWDESSASSSESRVSMSLAPGGYSDQASSPAAASSAFEHWRAPPPASTSTQTQRTYPAPPRRTVFPLVLESPSSLEDSLVAESLASTSPPPGHGYDSSSRADNEEDWWTSAASMQTRGMRPAALRRVSNSPPAPSPAYDELLLEYRLQQEELDEEMDLLYELAGVVYGDE